LLPWFSTLGVVIAYTVLYLLAFVLCAFISVTQPGLEEAKSIRRGTAGLLSTPHPETLKE
ncbi:cytochrome C biogenesis protein CcdA, partial [Enterobacter huaxiensis]